MARNLWIDYLRSFITILVVAHHSALAYTTFAYFDSSAYINSTAPVVDNARWIGMDIFENYNDIFFMSLMFLLSGLFITGSIKRKGAKMFVSDRLKRLGIPFLVAVTCIIPVAYLPSYYISHHNLNLTAFIKDYLTVEMWPVGPPWFIWILLLFNIIAAFIPLSFYNVLSGKLITLSRSLPLFIIAFFVIVSVSFIPISLWVGQYKWTGFGPFDFQVNRIFFYFVFFLLGVCLGNTDWESYFFTNNRLFNKSWLFWALISAGCYVMVELVTYSGAGIAAKMNLNATEGYFIFDLFFVASSIGSSLFFLSLFKQKIRSPNRLWTNFSANAYGIYLLHYIFLTPLQFLLLSVSLPVVIKFLLVFTLALFMSWIVINWLRKFSIINQLI